MEHSACGQLGSSGDELDLVVLVTFLVQQSQVKEL